MSQNGKYITLKPDDQSKAYLVSLMDKLELQNPVQEDDLHITIAFNVPEIPDNILLEELKNKKLVFSNEEIHNINKKRKPRNRP